MPNWQKKLYKKLSNISLIRIPIQEDSSMCPCCYDIIIMMCAEITTILGGTEQVVVICGVGTTVVLLTLVMLIVICEFVCMYRRKKSKCF